MRNLDTVGQMVSTSLVCCVCVCVCFNDVCVGSVIATLCGVISCCCWSQSSERVHAVIDSGDQTVLNIIRPLRFGKQPAFSKLRLSFDAVWVI